MKVLEKVIRCFALVAVLGVSAMSMGCAGEDDAAEPITPTTPPAGAPAGGAVDETGSTP